MDKPSGLRRSCEPCRLSKSRCVMPAGQETCERCSKISKECIFAQVRQRPKRVKTSAARVVDMERKVDLIFSYLSSGSVSASQPVQDGDVNVIQEDPLQSSTSEPSIGLEQSTNSSDLYDTPAWQVDSPPELIQPLRSYGQPSKQSDVIDRSLITSAIAEQAVLKFPTHLIHFPFIQVEKHETLNTLRRDRPFLLLAILATATCDDFVVQTSMEQELRQTLSQRVVLDGEKSMDILQGLLVYVAWFQYHFRPWRQQIFQFAQMAVAMAVDLGITSRSNPATKCGLVSHTDSRLAEGEDFVARKTFLGCYHISSSFAFALRKPSSLKYNDYVEECCQFVDASALLPSDKNVSCLIQLQRMIDEVNDTFDYSGYLQSAPLTASQIEPLLSSFRNQHVQIGRVFSKQIADSTAVRLTYRGLGILINEIAFYAVNPAQSDAHRPSTASWYFANSRSTALVHCIHAAKMTIDDYLQLPLPEIRVVTVAEYTSVVYAVIVLVQCMTGVDTPFMSVQDLRASTNLTNYLDRMIQKMSSSLTDMEREIKAGYTYHFVTIFQRTKAWVTDMLANETISQIRSSGTGIQSLGRPDFGVLGILNMVPESIFPKTPLSLSAMEPLGPKKPESVPAFMPAGMGADLSADVWGDIMSSWPGMDGAEFSDVGSGMFNS